MLQNTELAQTKPNTVHTTTAIDSVESAPLRGDTTSALMGGSVARLHRRPARNCGEWCPGGGEWPGRLRDLRGCPNGPQPPDSCLRSHRALPAPPPRGIRVPRAFA